MPWSCHMQSGWKLYGFENSYLFEMLSSSHKNFVSVGKDQNFFCPLAPLNKMN